MAKILVTGANGFIGQALCSALTAQGMPVKRVMRTGISGGLANADNYVIATIDATTDWQTALKGVDTVVHLAGRAHVMKESARDPLAAFRATNVAATLNLARQAASAGVRRFVLVSSIKVNGEATLPGEAFTAEDDPAPVGPYALSKWEAEQGLRQIAEATGLPIVIIRPPLVYGPGVKANFLMMLRYLDKGWPWPLAAVTNQRSFLSLGNLIDVIMICLTHPAAISQTFLLSDGEDLSTAALLAKLAEALGKPARMLPVPVPVLDACLKMMRREDLMQRLCGNLQIEQTKTQQLLAWTPRLSVDEGLRQTAEHYLATR